MGSDNSSNGSSSRNNDNSVAIKEEVETFQEQQLLQQQPSRGGIRLNKVFKATHSRREADALIKSGRVCVNGVPVEANNLGKKVVPFQDVISLDGKVIDGWEAMNAINKREIQNNTQMQIRIAKDHRSQSGLHDHGDKYNHSINNNDDDLHHHHRTNNAATSSSSSSFEYIKYYKPVGVTCTTDSRIKDNIIDDLIHNHGYRPRHRVYPVGRLDKETSGLILLTSDGRVVNSVLRGENKHAKVYNVMVNDSLTETDLQRLRVSFCSVWVYYSFFVCSIARRMWYQLLRHASNRTLSIYSND